MPKITETQKKPPRAKTPRKPATKTPVSRKGGKTPKDTVWEAPALVEPQEGDHVVSYSELSTYRSCPLKHLLSYKERWSKPPEEGSPLSKGTLWHEVMEVHYTGIQDVQQGRKTEDEAKAWIAHELGGLLWDQNTGEQSELQELIFWMYEGYVDKYGFDSEWEILGVEVKFQQRLHGPDGPSPFILKGKLDLVVRDRKTKKIWVVDHKSGANLPVEEDLDMNDQFALYIWLLNTAGIPVIGAIHSANRTTMNAGDRKENQDENGVPLKASTKKQTLDQRMKRTLMARGKRELDNVARDAWATAANAYPEAVGLEPLPVYSNPDTMPFTWRYEWRDVYLMARKGRDVRVALKELGFEQNFERH